LFESPSGHCFAAVNRFSAASGLAQPTEYRHTMYMTMLPRVCFAVSILLLSFVALSQTRTTPKHQPVYTQDGQLRLPADYREWVFLSSGFDMSYNPDMAMDRHMFDNVFVDPEAWKAFQSTGKWPAKTLLVLELRRAEGKGSINQKGNFQAVETMGIEVHVKDESRFKGNWAFFGFSPAESSAKMIPLTEDCYSCHAEHGAVDTTFVQFYPTLKPIATRKGTLEAAYQKSDRSR
jgi:hypothetical protein